MAIQVGNLQKNFGRTSVLRGIDLSIEKGELVALLGPSGSGKTTLLKIIAGLEWPDAGALSVDGEDWLQIAARDRRIGFVFQHYALFPHMTVRDNIAFGLSVRPRSDRPGKSVIAAKVEELLMFLQIAELGNRYPNQLSGGQRQRVALGRALAIEPRILLLDEPFGALDAAVRRDLRRWLRGVHDETGSTTLFVTHDQEEAFELADRVVIMGEGKVEQIGTADQIHDHPASPFVARFMGATIELEVDIRAGRIGGHGIDGSRLERRALPDGSGTLFVQPSEITPILDLNGPWVTTSVTSTGSALRPVLVNGSVEVALDLPRRSPAAKGLIPGARAQLRPEAGAVFTRAEARRAHLPVQQHSLVREISA